MKNKKISWLTFAVIQRDFVSYDPEESVRDWWENLSAEEQWDVILEPFISDSEKKRVTEKIYAYENID